MRFLKIKKKAKRKANPPRNSHEKGSSGKVGDYNTLKAREVPQRFPAVTDALNSPLTADGDRIYLRECLSRKESGSPSVCSFAG